MIQYVKNGGEGMENTYNIIHVDFKGERIAQKYNLWQYDYNQILQISGLSLPATVEIHFSLTEKSGKAETRVATTENGITQVQIPNELLRNDGKSGNYSIFAFIYVVDEDSGNTEYEIILHVDSRPAPGEIAEDLDEPHPFDEAVNAVNAAAKRAEQAEQNAKASAIEAGKYAASASESATAAEKNKKDALREVEEKKQEAIEAIQEQEETSVGKITTHTDDEIQRILNQTAEPKRELEQTITNADASKRELDHSIETAGTSKTALDKSVELAGTAKTELDTSTQKAGEAKTALDGSAKTAGEMQQTLSATVKQAGTLDTSLGEKIETGTQLKTDLTVSGEKAVQDIQTAGSKQLGKMQAVAEEITADREQIATNKEDIGSLKEDLSNKITKFYASNQGETHLADSDNGKIMDMMLYGMSEQKQYSGKNLLKYPYIETTKTSQGITFTDNKDGSINVSGTATGTAYYNLYSNRDGKRLTLASGTYKLVTKGRSGCNVTVNNGVISAKNEGTFTITEGNNEIYCYIAIQEGLTVDETIYPMIQLASSIDESYEPYTGGKPSPNPDYPQEIKSVVNPVVKVCGKNLWNPIEGGYISNLNGSTTASDKLDTATTDFIKTNGKDITVIARNFSLAIACAYAYRIGFYDAEKKWIKNVVLSDGNKHSINTFNITDAEYIRVSAPSDLYDTIQIEKGSEATSYEPYTEQFVQLHYTLNATPVVSGGNITIGGQQYIADYVDVERGKYVQRVGLRDIPDNVRWSIQVQKKEEADFALGYIAFENAVSTRVENVMLSNVGKSSERWSNTFCFGITNVFWLVPCKNDGTITSDDINAWLAKHPMKVLYKLKEPIENDLAPEEIEALKTLSANYPVTNVSVTSDQLDGYTVFNYPISMANGWNYVKQQLGDTRDYIYDMDAKAQDIDIQSAEAYVNSEYAVTLTELEV